MRWHTALFGLLVGTATASCAFLLDFEELQAEQPAGTGGAAGSDSGDAQATIPIGEAAQKFADAVCARLEECMPGALVLLYGDTPCVDFTARRLADGVLAGLDQLPKDTAEYHPEQAPACVAALRASGAGKSQCPKALDWPAECEKAVEGKVTEGKGCVHPSQCAPGLYCDLGTTAITCPGICTKKLGVDAPCYEGQCQEGLRCQELKALEKSFCKKPVDTAGAPCGGDDLPSCALGMLCVGMSFDQDAGADAGASPGKCKLAESVFGFGPGSKCDWSNGDLCLPGLHCKLTDGQGNGTCVATALVDEPCGLAIPDMCPTGQYCQPNVFQPPQVSLAGACTNLPGVDDPCALDAIYNEDCKADTRCVGGFCKALIPIGPVQCKENAVCYSGLCNNVCVPPIFCPP